MSTTEAKYLAINPITRTRASIRSAAYTLDAMRTRLQFRSHPFRMLACGLVMICFFVSHAAAQALQPSSVIDLGHVKIAGTNCVFHLPADFASIHWLDDTRLLVSSGWVNCDQPAAGNAKKSGIGAVLFDRKGTILASTYGRETEYTRGPHATVAATQDGTVDLLDGTMHTMQKLACPGNSKRCGIHLDPFSAIANNFALCFYSDLKRPVCDFYEDWPAEKIRREVLQSLADPYTRLADHTWRVSPDEQWHFQSGHLVRVRTDGTTSLVSPTDFVGGNGGGCDGQMSETSPRRFLATCYGAHWYSDGMFDNIFGFSHTVLFDVATGNILGQVDGGAYIRTSLSLSGQQIAILKGNKVRLYDVP